jgi:tripartite-type tricarboxylate transporter receptor subunit TctC
LAVTSREPSALFPGLATIAAAVPGYEAVTPYGVLAPARTPEAVIKRLNEEIVRLIARPDVKEKFFNVGVETVGSSPEQFASTMKADMAKLAKVIKEAGIRAD